MSSNPPQAPSAISPLAIATAFIKQYYLILSTNNSFIHKFYKAKSQISFSPSCNTPAISQPFSSLENVEEKFAWAANSRVDFANGSIDAQESVDGGILVVVTGEMFLEGANDKKLFVQTFFLKDDGRGAPRRNFFVFNDVFRFLERENKVEVKQIQDEQIVDAVEETVTSEEKKMEMRQDVAQSEETVETMEMNGNHRSSTLPTETYTEPELHSESNPIVTGNSETEELEKPCEQEEASPTEDTSLVVSVEPTDTSNHTTDFVDTIEDAHNQESSNTTKAPVTKSSQKSKPPGSWASLVAGSSPKAGTSASTETPTPAPATKSPPKKDKEKDNGNVAPSTNVERPKRPPRPQESETESSNMASGATNSRASGYGSKGSSSLYIKNVGDGINESDLRDLFTEYPFKIVNVSFYPSRGYAFVDFADANAVNSIMKENRQTFHVNGRAIEVEKKSSDRRRAGGNNGGAGNGSRGGGGGGNQISTAKGQRQRSHSGRRLNGGSDGDRRGRKGRSGGGGDKKRDSSMNGGVGGGSNN